jgi:hypothetical protein
MALTFDSKRLPAKGMALAGAETIRRPKALPAGAVS